MPFRWLQVVGASASAGCKCGLAGSESARERREFEADKKLRDAGQSRANNNKEQSSRSLNIH